MLGFDRDPSGRARLGGADLEQLFHSSGAATPAYFYDLDGIVENATAVLRALDSKDLVAYAVKANSAGSIIRALARLGVGADVVSGGELELVVACGVAPANIVMSGVAKADDEIDLALQLGIRALHAESVEELERIAARARTRGRVAPVTLRINPGVEIDSHSHIATGHDAAKFGIPKQDLERAWMVVDQYAELKAVGISTHVGSMLAAPEAYLASARSVCEQAKLRRAKSEPVSYLDFGGGFGIDYGGQNATPAAEFAASAKKLLADEQLTDHDLLIEPGRSLVGPYGVIVARVIQTKRGSSRRWLMLDAGMNDLIRPALYSARHRIESLTQPPSASAEPWRVVGPVCESSDDFGEHPLGNDVPQLVVIRDAGAYGFTLASEYNGRALPTEVFVSGKNVKSVSATPGRSAWVQRRLNA